MNSYCKFGQVSATFIATANKSALTADRDSIKT